MSNWTIHEQLAFVLFMFALGFIFGYVAAWGKPKEQL